MSNFSLGSGGAKTAKASTLPEGTIVRISAASFSPSRYTQVIQKGSNAGREVPKYQLHVDLVPVAGGETVSQYLGGVYPKDYDDLSKGYTLTEEGSSRAFMQSLVDAGLTMPSAIEGLAGFQFAVTHVKGGVGKMAYDHVHAKAGSGQQTAAAPAATPVPAVKTAPTAGTPSAFDALSQAHRDILLAAVGSGEKLTPADLIEANMAKTEVEATAVIAAIPRPTGKLLGRKA